MTEEVEKFTDVLAAMRAASPQCAAFADRADKSALAICNKLIAQIPEWQPIETAPQNTLGVAVVARLLCGCDGHEGGRMLMVAARQDGKWWHTNEHEVEFTHWSPLPELPFEIEETRQ